MSKEFDKQNRAEAFVLFVEPPSLDEPVCGFSVISNARLSFNF
jgi:hypothetical protein